jgi:hypothetical protein
MMRRFSRLCFGARLWCLSVGLWCLSVGLAQAQSYCPSSSSSRTEQWIQRVEVNGLPLSSTLGGYVLHPRTGAGLRLGESTLQVDPGHPSTDPAAAFVRAWVDFNRDGVFADTEMVAELQTLSRAAARFWLPAGASGGLTRMRVSLASHGYPTACEQFDSGEVEDIPIWIQGPGGPNPFPLVRDLDLEPDFRVHRNGYIGDPVHWVVERGGTRALSANGAGELVYRYHANSSGSVYRIFLEQFVAGAYLRVSDVVEYEPGVSNLYLLTLDWALGVTRSGTLDFSAKGLLWVVERDGQIALERSAENELAYLEPELRPGSEYRVWLKKPNGPGYQVVSNAVEFQPEQQSFELTLDQRFKVRRDGQPGDPLTWVVEENAQIVLESSASSGFELFYAKNRPGSAYRIWLRRSEPGGLRVSNAVSYAVPASYPFTLALGASYRVTRSGQLGDSVNWVIARNGQVVLRRLASNELSYVYYANSSGGAFEVYLERFEGGYYRPVSNTVTYTIRP